MKKFTLFAAMLVAMFATPFASGQEAGDTLLEAILSSQDMLPAEPLYPDNCEGNIYTPVNPVYAPICIERWDANDVPTIVYSDYDDFLESNTTELQNYATCFPNGVKAVYRTWFGTECHYHHFPETETEVTVNEAVEMLFVMDDFWGAVNFLTAPATTITIDDPVKRTNGGYVYVIKCGKRIYIGETGDIGNRWKNLEDGYKMKDCIGNDDTCVWIGPIQVDDKDPIDTKAADMRKIRLCIERMFYIYIRYNPGMIINNLWGTVCIDNSAGGILGGGNNENPNIEQINRCWEMFNHYHPAVTKLKKMKFKKKPTADWYVPVNCEPTDKEKIPGYEPPDWAK